MPTPDDVPEPMQMLSFPTEIDDTGAGGALTKMVGIKAGGKFNH